MAASSFDQATIIFVCTSNVCRSPMAEYLAKRHLHNMELKTKVISRGLTSSYSRWGSPANARALQVMKELFDIDISAHKSKPLTASDMENASVIFVVTSDHLDWVKSAVPKQVYAKNEHKIRTVGIDVPDPYFFQYVAYQDVAKMLEEQVPEALQAFLDGKPGSRTQDPRSEARNNRCYGSWPRK